jgi:tetratricopeptide (TPR) repeat protein
MLEMVDALATIEEPKTIVLVSEGFLQDQETYGYFQEFSRAAARARVNLYAVHFESLIMDATRSKASPTLTEDMDLQTDGLANLASMSGGAMFRATAAGTSAFERVEKELTGFYLLSFEAEDNDRDGEPHEIRVRLRDGSGHAIRARGEFVIPPEPAERSEADRLADTLREPFSRSDLPITVATYNIKDSSTLEPRALVSAAIGTGGSAPSEALVGFTLVDENGDTTEKKAEKITRAKGAKTALPFAASIPVSSGIYRLRLAAVDSEGRAGSVEHDFQTKTLTAGDLELSDLLLLDPRAQKGKAPLTSSLTTAAGKLDMYLELYSRENDALQGVTVTFEIADDEKGAHRARTTVAAKSAVPYGRWIAEGSVPLESLPPADYVARAIVSKSASPITKLSRPFRLARGMATDAIADTEAIPEGPAKDYVALLGHYQNGQTIGAISTLNRMSGADIANALEVIEGIGLTQEQNMTAALLHTEVALNGNDEAYHLEIARERIARIEDDDARVAFQKRWFMAVGLHFWKLNRAEEALDYLDRANDLDPTDVEPIMSIASIYEAIGWVTHGSEPLERAETAYRAVLKGNSENVEARLRLGHVFKIRSRPDDALEELHWVLEHTEEPNLKMIAHLLIGDLHKYKELVDEAVESYHTAVSLDPLCQVAVTALSQALHQRGELEASRAVIDAFFQRKDTFVGKHDGWRRYLHGDPKRSQSLLKELQGEIR